jgi:hypothetical protein
MLPTAPLIGLTLVIVAVPAAALVDAETRIPAEDGAIQTSASAAANTSARRLFVGAAPHMGFENRRDPTRPERQIE